MQEGHKAEKAERESGGHLAEHGLHARSCCRYPKGGVAWDNGVKCRHYHGRLTGVTFGGREQSWRSGVLEFLNEKSKPKLTMMNHSKGHDQFKMGLHLAVRMSLARTCL